MTYLPHTNSGDHMQQPITVTYKHTSNVYEANQFLREISQYPLIACDFEIAIRYTQAELDSYRIELESYTNKRRWQQLHSRLNATALDHPSHCTLTHCSIAISESEAYVFILDNPRITNRVLQFLVTTPIKQIWHNASFDFKHIYYHMGKMPSDFEDTQIFAKTILNHVDVQQATTGLKQLAGKWYGDWGLSEDNFTTDSYYDPKMLKYSAIDAAATYKLWLSINSYAQSDVSNNSTS